ILIVTSVGLHSYAGSPSHFLSPMKLFASTCLLLSCLFGAGAAIAQTCAAPGKDSPGTVSGIVNTYYPGSGSLAPGATALTLGTPASGATGTVTVGDLLMVIQMQGASIDTSDDERYGDGAGTAAATPDSSASQANGYLALNEAGNYDFVRVTAAAGAAITFAPALAGTYTQNTASPRRTYQVVRVPQYPSVTINSAAPVLPLAWTGLVGGVVAIDVAGRTTFSGTGPHIDASNRGFRGGAQGVPDSTCCNVVPRNYRSALTADGGGKAEGIAGTPRYVNNSIAGTYNSGTRFSDAVGGTLDNGGANIGYTSGDFMRGAPANAGGGGSSHNAAGGGGGNGGEGGNGGQTYNGDGLRDLGGYGGSRTPKDGVFLATRIFMGGGGGSGSLNNDSGNRGEGGNGGGIAVLRTGSVSGSGILRSDGQRGWDADASNDAGGGGGAGGSVLFIASSGHGNITAQARGGDGANSNVTTGSTAFSPPTGDQGACCGGEREGPGGGGGGGAVYANSTLGSLSLGGGVNGLSREDKAGGFSGNMRASSGNTGASVQTLSSSAFQGVRPGYECLPVLTASKRTSTPARAVPPDTTGGYSITISNPAAGSGAVYGVALSDLLPSPFTLTGTLFTATFSAGASGGGFNGPSTNGFSTAGAGTSTVIFGVPGDPVNAITLQPGAAVTLTFVVALNAATAGTYQNPASINMTDPTRTSGGAATAATNPYVAPGGTNAVGGSVAGSNYIAASSTQEDIVVTGTAGTSADLALVKSGSAAAEVGQAVAYQLVITNSGPSNLTGSITISDSVPAAIGTVTWVCSLFAGTGDCDTASGGTSAIGSGNTILLSRVSLNSGGEIHLDISGTAASAGNITNTATVAVPAGYTDPVPTNNTGTATTTITVPTADLSVTKSDGATTATSGGVTVYTINAVNSGPSKADNAVVTDALAAGLSKLSISCSAQGGATCPSGLSTATFQAGATIPLFPANSTVTFLLSTQVTAASGTVTNTVAVTGPAGLVEINTANNAASDANAVTVTAVFVSSSAQICPAGSTESTVNLLSNSDFSNTSASVGTNITQYPVNTDIPNDGVAPQTGAQAYAGSTVSQRAFPGDAARSVGSATNWLYSNGNAGGAAFVVWSQPVSGLVAGRNYEWLYYGSNAQSVGSAVANTPQIQFRLVAGTTTFTLGGTDGYANEAAGTTDTWTLRQRSFGATTTGVTLQLWETQTAGAGTGDTFASTQILLRECTPNAEPFVTKSNGTGTVQTLATTSYIITVGNNGPGAAGGIVVKDAAATGLSKTAVSCSASGTGAQCPLSLTVSGLEGAGLTVPALPANTTLVFTVTATVTALNGTVTNTVSLQLPAGMTDSNLANNSATDIDAVKGSANITISKSNGVGTVTAGGTTGYTLTVANLGPSDASGAVLSDPVATGLSCTTAATCTASGGASCAASVPIATLQSGYTIPVLPSGGQVTLVLNCAVTATGQ
ncbi:MAG: hypothetical protein JWQ72_464, partial [Polaromonas sp.]|nr:hypothetical protein [Polaromonas sp.]